MDSNKRPETMKRITTPELAAAFIVSQVTIVEGEGELAVTVNKAEGEKCERCWGFSKTVGENADHPTLCSRCAAAIK